MNANVRSDFFPRVKRVRLFVHCLTGLTLIGVSKYYSTPYGQDQIIKLRVSVTNPLILFKAKVCRQ